MNKWKTISDLHYLTSIWSMPLNLFQVLLLWVDGPGKSHCPKVNMIKQIKLIKLKTRKTTVRI